MNPMVAENTETPEGKITVLVEEELRDLIPGYLAHRRQDGSMIREALPKGDFETIRSLGHKMKGSGGGYGFERITDIGRALEEAAKAENREEIARQAAALTDYLERVECIFQG